MKHEGGDRDKIKRTWRQINGSMNNTAKDLDHTELMMVAMMVMTIKMNRSGCMRKRETASPQ